MSKGFAPDVAKRKAGATYWDVKEQRFGGMRFWARGLKISMKKYVLEG